MSPEHRRMFAETAHWCIRDHISGTDRVELGQSDGRPVLNVWTATGEPIDLTSPTYRGFPVAIHRSHT